MKKTDYVFLVTVILFSILFYKQMAGLNFLIFSCILILGQILMRPGIFRNGSWILSAIGAMATSFCVLYYGNLLSILASLVSLLLASYFAFQKDGSILIGIISSFISSCASIGFMISRIFERQKNKSIGNTGNKAWKKTVIVVFALFVVLIFFLMYRESSVLFYNLTQKINFDWISIGWIGFTLLGALIVYGFYFHNSIPGLSEWDGKRVLISSPQMDETFWDKIMSMESEKFTGLVLFSLLNVLLLVVNGLDLAFIFNNNGHLPQGVSCKEYVHQGVGMLIASIVFAMLIILYFFRGRLNFMEKGKALRYLAILWIVQNAFMLYSTAWRNDVYILAFGLTYKRIGVFIYLLLALIGLVVTAWKVLGKKTNAFLIRTNSWLFYGIWVIACFPNWDAIVFNNNIKMLTNPDMDYLNSLSDDILPELVTYINQHPNVGAQYGLGESVQLRAYLFLNKEKYRQDKNMWPSFRIKVNEELNEFNYQDRFGLHTTLNLNYHELKYVYYFQGFDSIRSMELSGNDLVDLGEIGDFKNLQVLDVSNNPDLKSISGIEKLNKLEYLAVNGTAIIDYSPLLKLKNLKRITVDDVNGDWVVKLKRANSELEIEQNNYDR